MMKDYANPIVVKSNKPSMMCYAFGVVVYICFSLSFAYAVLGGIG